MNWLHTDIRKKIDEHGNAVIGVMGERDKPAFSYTIGLSPQYKTELIIVGTNPIYGQEFLNYITQEILAKGVALEIGVPTDIGANFPAKFQVCQWDKVVKYAVQAFDFYRTDDVKFMQVVMPDAKGLFPDDPAFDHAYMDPRQPLLY